MATGKKTIIIVTDAWEPQTNGVVTTYKNTIAAMPPEQKVVVVHPGMFKCWKNPFYKDILIPRCSKKDMENLLAKIMKEERNVAFHIATEGVLGFHARRILAGYGIRYTTAYHTKFPEFLRSMFGIPTIFTRWYFHWFHKNSRTVLMSSNSVAKRFKDIWNTTVISKGFADHFTFKDHARNELPILLYVGRVSKEKNIEAFLKVKLMFAHRKVVVGGGPILESLKKKYPDAEFVGPKYGAELATYYQDADVFVFPSKTDTFGLVVLEAMACGTPVAAYPVDGAVDQISNGYNGFVSENLNVAINRALECRRTAAAGSVDGYSWSKAAKQFIVTVTGG
jgi:glycosyltransferase involved in cell wall biosynthesis